MNCITRNQTHYISRLHPSLQQSAHEFLQTTKTPVRSVNDINWEWGVLSQQCDVLSFALKEAKQTSGQTDFLDSQLAEIRRKISALRRERLRALRA